MYTAHTSALSFKDNRLRSQVPTSASTLAPTSDHFRSSWRLGPSHTPRMRMDPLLQWKGPGRGMPPLHAPNRKISLLSKLTLALATCLNVRRQRDPRKCTRLLGELSKLNVNVTAVQETHFICTADARLLEDDFVILSAFGGRCSAGVSVLIRRSLNADVDLVFSGDGGRLVVTDVAV